MRITFHQAKELPQRYGGNQSAFSADHIFAPHWISFIARLPLANDEELIGLIEERSIRARGAISARPSQGQIRSRLCRRTDSPQLLDEFLKTMKGGATARGCGCGEALRPSIWSWALSLPAGTMLLLHQLSWLGMLTQTIILRFCICALDLSGRGCMRTRLRRKTGRARWRRGCRRGSAGQRNDGDGDGAGDPPAALSRAGRRP